MRAFPIDAAAGLAGGEALVALAHHRRQPVEHLRLVDIAQRLVAFQAEREGAQAADEVEAMQDLPELQRRLQGMHVAAVGQLAQFQQLAVARQHDAGVAHGEVDDLAIIEVVAVEGVEAGHAQQVGQAAEVRVGDEARLAQRPLAQAQQGRHVEGLELRIDADAVAVGDQPAEADRLAVDQDQLDFSMGDSQRLDHVLDGGGAGAGRGEIPLAPLRREEVVQLLVEAEGGGDHTLVLDTATRPCGPSVPRE